MPKTLSEPAIDAATLRRLSTISLWRWIAAVLGDWAMIGAAVAAFYQWPHWAVYVGAVFLIGTRQHALGILVHESVHHRVAAVRSWNDVLSDYLAGYPLLTPTEGYRAFHLKHHRLLDTADDPERVTIDKFPREWTYPMPPGRFWRLLLRDLSGLWPLPSIALLRLTWDIPGRRLVHLGPIVTLHLAVVLALLALGRAEAYVLFWLVPLNTVLPACFRLRTAADHSGIAAAPPRYTRATPDILGATRTTVSTPIGRFFLAPHGINYHIEHHFYPSVPFFRLPEMHRLLQSAPDVAARSHRADGYAQVIRELTGAGRTTTGRAA